MDRIEQYNHIKIPEELFDFMEENIIMALWNR